MSDWQFNASDYSNAQRLDEKAGRVYLTACPKNAQGKYDPNLNIFFAEAQRLGGAVPAIITQVTTVESKAQFNQAAPKVRGYYASFEFPTIALPPGVTDVSHRIQFPDPNASNVAHQQKEVANLVEAVKPALGIKAEGVAGLNEALQKLRGSLAVPTQATPVTRQEVTVNQPVNIIMSVTAGKKDPEQLYIKVRFEARDGSGESESEVL